MKEVWGSTEFVISKMRVREGRGMVWEGSDGSRNCCHITQTVSKTGPVRSLRKTR